MPWRRGAVDIAEKKTRVPNPPGCKVLIENIAMLLCTIDLPHNYVLFVALKG
jgi:hypothetical protein